MQIQGFGSKEITAILRHYHGTWSKKGKKSQFGYKLHTLIDKEW